MIILHVVISFDTYVPELLLFFQALWDLAERVGEVRNRGMKEEEINRLPNRVYRHGKGENCSICLSEFESGDRLSLLPCTHEYHKECLKEWLKVSWNTLFTGKCHVPHQSFHWNAETHVNV